MRFQQMRNEQQSGHSESEEAGAGETLIRRLREATSQFEESHPALTEVVGRIADVLSHLGI